MIGREKVIKGLECIVQQMQNGTCNGCVYFRPFTDDPDYGWCDKVAIENDALALLREQEPVKPIDPCKSCQEWDCNGCEWLKLVKGL
jgi:hypothetical protein